MSDISVIIRCKNEEQWIGHCIQSVIDLIYKPEIIIVNNNSIDKSIRIVESFKEISLLEGIEPYTKLKISDISDINYTPGRALNLGVKASTKKYILIISSHCILTKINLQKHKEDLDKGYCVIFGDQQPFWMGKKIKKRYIWANFGDKEVINYYSEFEKRYFLHNALALYKKNTLVSFPFNEELMGKEDRYWINNMIIEEKYSSLYDPELSANHHYTPEGSTWKGIG